MNATAHNDKHHSLVATNQNVPELGDTCDKALGQIASLLVLAIGELRAIRSAIERAGVGSATKNALVTPREFASLLAVSVRELRRMRAAGELPRAVGSHKRPRWKRADVEAFIAKSRARR